MDKEPQSYWRNRSPSIRNSVLTGKGTKRFAQAFLSWLVLLSSMMRVVKWSIHKKNSVSSIHIFLSYRESNFRDRQTDTQEPSGVKSRLLCSAPVERKHTSNQLDVLFSSHYCKKTGVNYAVSMIFLLNGSQRSRLEQAFTVFLLHISLSCIIRCLEGRCCNMTADASKKKRAKTCTTIESLITD